MCILNTLIPWSTSPLPCSLPAPGAFITDGNDAVMLRGGRWAGRWENQRERHRWEDREKEKESDRRKIFMVTVFPSFCLWLFFLFSLLINCWNITVRFWAHIAVFYARWMRLLLNVLWSISGKFVCVRENKCMSVSVVCLCVGRDNVASTDSPWPHCENTMQGICISEEADKYSYKKIFTTHTNKTRVTQRGWVRVISFIR